MILKYILAVFIITSIFSCNKTTSKTDLQIVNDTIIATKIKVVFKDVKLNSKAQKEVENWTEYQKMSEFIQQFSNISKTDALFNANELSELAQQLKDSIRVEKFKISSVIIRLNVLHNEALRLADLATINNISEKDVQDENKKILDAFSALNSKINNLIDQEKINIQLNAFINEVVSSDKSKRPIHSPKDSILK